MVVETSIGGAGQMQDAVPHAPWHNLVIAAWLR